MRLTVRSLALAAAGLVAVLLVGFFVLRGRAPEIPPSALAARDEALSWARRDDASALERGAKQLASLTKAHPSFFEARAQLAVLQTLQLDDARVELGRLDESEQTLLGRIGALERAQAPNDWLSRVNVLKDELVAVRGARPPVVARQTRLERQLDASLKALGTPEEGEDAERARPRLRALAYEAAIRGDDAALRLSERLKQAGGSEQDSSVIYAEYVLNSHAPPESVGSAAAALEKLRSQDESYVRPYVLGARLSLRERRLEDARSLLDTALSLNAKHALARHLRDWTEAMLERAGSEP